MATSVYKTLLDSDKASTRTLLHEYIPITGTILSGTYGGNTVAAGSETNIKTYSHGMFQSVYDYPYLSSSANHILDISVGFTTRIVDVAAPIVAHEQEDKKLNMYAQMAQVLQGYDKDNNIAKFDQDGRITNEAGDIKLEDCIFISLTRLLTKDEIKKGSFRLDLDVQTTLSLDDVATDVLSITDVGASDDYFTSTAGEYAVLYGGKADSEGSRLADLSTRVGLLYYQAGVAVLTSSIFALRDASTLFEDGGPGILTGTVNADPAVDHSPKYGMYATGDGTAMHLHSFQDLMTGSTIDHASNFMRSRILNLTFNNTTELNSMVYFCRANHNEFNYSANRTYLNGSKIRVKNTAQDLPRSYVTTVGLYSANNELMAVAKLSEPIRKDPTNEVTLRVRLDY